MDKKILFFLLAVISIVPVTVLAAEANPIQGIICRAGTVIGNSATAIIVISFILVGIFFLSAVANPERFSVAKKALFWAIMGTIVCLLAVSSITIIKNMIGVTTGGEIGCP